jgi:hypothetical protein
MQMALYLRKNGKIDAPGLDMLNILSGLPPASVALTRNAWEEFSVKPPTYFVNGPAVIGDGAIQNNDGVFRYGTRDEVLVGLNQLALDVYAAADQVGDPSWADQLEGAANTIGGAARTGETDSPRLHDTLQWLSNLANGTTAGVIAAGIVSAATALLTALQ